MLWKDDMLNISQAVNILDHIKSSREDKSSLLDYFITSNISSPYVGIGQTVLSTIISS